MRPANVAIAFAWEEYLDSSDLRKSATDKRREQLRVKVVINMAKRDTYKYDFKIRNTIKHSGVTNDLDRREGEHQQRWPDGHIVQVGRKTTRDAAEKWEESKHKVVTPKRG